MGRCSRLLKVWRLPWEKMNAGLELTDVLPVAQKERNSLLWSWSLEQRDAYEKLIVTSNKVTEQC